MLAHDLEELTMKLASVELRGKKTFGAIVDDGFVDLGARLGASCPDLIGLFETDALARARALAQGPADARLDELVYRPVNPRRDMRMFALGWAYKAHQLEAGKEDLAHPNMFSKHPQSLVGHGQPIVRPRLSDRFDFEGEVAIVMGKGGRHIPPAQALAHIGGYSIVMDGSVRDYQKHSVTAGKNFDASSSFGPWLVTPDELGEPKKMVLSTRLNGQLMQHSGFDLMAWDLAELIAYVSGICALEPGDVISTGTPGGVGHRREPQVFMKAGDVLEVEVSGIGVLRNAVVDETA
jgi:2-keto-4-pentenoate hydratase/2-oxohepta-3-ene-1,7-dioic acid hydratase in catechol pathway